MGPCPYSDGRCNVNVNDTVSVKPIRYFNGQVMLSRTDVASSGFGMPFSHTRTYCNQLPSSFTLGNGWNWQPSAWPYLATTNVSGAALAMYEDMAAPRYFSQNPTTNAYAALFGDTSTFVHNTASQQFVLTNPDGSIVTFNDFTTTNRPGQFVSRLYPNGVLEKVTQQTATQIVEIQRTQLATGGTTESFLYAYMSPTELWSHFLPS